MTIPNHNSLTFTWPVAPSGGSDIIRYEVRVWDNAASDWVVEDTVDADADKEDGTTDDTPYSYTAEELASSTRYYYIVRAVNSDGAGPWSAFVTGVTTGGNPDAPTLTATALSGTSIKLGLEYAEQQRHANHGLRTPENGLPMHGQLLPASQPLA